ncbi:uncharacterized protein LOC111246297 isoform X2 [Varroa destructor]|uniref:Uncharacterized protein n=1 Tax=Varroa destructor TaxID=109461 RepID=A0A7M7JFI0_VARDE|nr:uncharacterized protein LOC111246297 isoform X2 [Varroa destructor]
MIKLIIKMVSMSSRILAFLPFDPRAIQQLRRLRSKFLRTFDPGGKWRQLTDGAYHVWQAFIGLSTLTVLLRSSGSDDILWPVVVAAKSLFDLVLVVRAGTDPLSLFGAGSRRRKWNVQLLDTIYHRIWIVVVTVRLQFYASLAIYDSDAIELELLLLLRKVINVLPRLLLHTLIADVHQVSGRDETQSSVLRDRPTGNPTSNREATEAKGAEVPHAGSKYKSVAQQARVKLHSQRPNEKNVGTNTS